MWDFSSWMVFWIFLMNIIKKTENTMIGMMAPNTVLVSSGEMVNMMMMVMMMKREPLMNIEMLVPSVSWIT